MGGELAAHGERSKAVSPTGPRHREWGPSTLTNLTTKPQEVLLDCRLEPVEAGWGGGGKTERPAHWLGSSTLNDQGYRKREQSAQVGTCNWFPKVRLPLYPSSPVTQGSFKRLPWPARAGFLKTTSLFSKAKLLLASHYPRLFKRFSFLFLNKKT